MHLTNSVQHICQQIFKFWYGPSVMTGQFD